MAHQQEEIFQEFRNAIERLVPLTPKEVIDEAKKLAEGLESNEASTPEQIRQALVYIGRKEFPYRKAYLELCAGDEEARLQEIVLHKLDDATKALLEPVTKYGVHILDFVKSSQFEEFSDDAKVAIDNAIRVAHDLVNRQCDERAASRAESYKTLVAHWALEAENVQKLIDVLKDMAERDPQWRDEILSRARQFENGFSMIEEDPTREAVEKEISYWAGVLGDSESAGETVE
ncbi:MAG: hypothetical protein WCT28_03950 [Patescibacteria group bacterium]|jgi:hypothetical protein